MLSMFSPLSWMFAVTGGGGDYHDLVSLPLFLRDPCILQLLVDIVVLPNDPPPGDHDEVDTSETGGGRRRTGNSRH